MKNFFKVILSSLVIVLAVNINAFALDDVPEVSAEGMILLDAATGEILAEKNSNEKLAPASTTKVMTALLTLENTKLDDIVVVGENPPFADGSSIALKEGDMYTVENLLHALLLESSNDSAIALAEHIAGSEAEFAKMMTKRAKELGAKNTNFMNSSGLYDENHYTTAYDLSLIMKEALKHESYVQISQIQSYELPASKVDGETKWVNNSTTMYNPNNSNYMPELIAAKTGYTEVARCSYVAAGKKDNQTLVCVLLKSESKTENFNDTKALFNYGFDNFDLIKIYDKNETVTTVKINEEKEFPLITTEDIYYITSTANQPLTRGISNDNNIKTTINLEQKDLSKQNFKAGDKVLKAKIIVDNKPYTEVLLASTVGNEYSTMDSIIQTIKTNFLWIISGFVIILILIFILKDKLFHLKYRRKTKRIIFKNNKLKL